MAKSPRTGGVNRGRRVADKRRVEEAAAPETGSATADDRGVTVADAVEKLPAPAREEIARRAYAIFRARGGTHGYDIDDWLQAERELRGR